MSVKDEDHIKVLAMFTKNGEEWPIGAWYCWDVNYNPCWNTAKPEYKRYNYHLSELEANAKGIYRPGTEPK